jgi:lipopolysaccharide/colanic/teichoic acid biosynthesis glycosyltransferase
VDRSERVAIEVGAPSGSTGAEPASSATRGAADKDTVGRIHTSSPLGSPRTVARSSPFVRAADLVAGVLLLLISGPVIAVIALTVRASSHGPVRHREPVLDARGRRTHLLSFRTMVDGAGTDHHERLRAVIGAAHAGAHYTGIGRLLERTGLVHLPRLVNVLGGTASLFGASRGG